MLTNGSGALLIVSNYILGLDWGNDSIYLFDLHSKDDNISSFATTVFLSFDVYSFSVLIYYIN